MRGVDIKPTYRFENEDKYNIELPEKNADLTIKFIDAAGDNSAKDLIR